MLVSILFSNWNQCRLVLVHSWHPSVFYWVKFRSEEIMKFVFICLSGFCQLVFLSSGRYHLKLGFKETFCSYQSCQLVVYCLLFTQDRHFKFTAIYVQDSLWNCSITSQITNERANNSVQPQRYPKSGSTKSYYNLLWITIVQICCSSSME